MNNLPTPAQVAQMNQAQKVEAFRLFLSLGYSAKTALRMAGL